MDFKKRIEQYLFFRGEKSVFERKKTSKKSNYISKKMKIFKENRKNSVLKFSIFFDFFKFDFCKLFLFAKIFLENFFLDEKIHIFRCVFLKSISRSRRINLKQFQSVPDILKACKTSFPGPVQTKSSYRAKCGLRYPISSQFCRSSV